MRNTMVNVLNIIWGLAFALVLPPFVIRTLGKDNYGVWVLVNSFSVLSGYLSFLDLGLQATIVKFVAEHNARAEMGALERVFGNALTAYLILGGLGSGALVVFATWFLGIFQIPAELVGTTQILFYILAIQVLFEFIGLGFSGVLEGLQRYDLLRLLDMVRLLIYALLVFFFLSQGYGLNALALLTAATMIGRMLIIVFLVKATLPGLPIRLHIDLETLRHFLGFTGKIFVIRINAVIYNQMDKAIIGVLLLSTLLTDYDIANKIHQLVLTSVTVVSGLIMPMASDLDARENLPGLQQLFLKVTKYTVALCLPTTVTAMILAHFVIRFWIGPEYVYNTGITQLFLVYLLFTAVIPVGQNMMIGMDRFGPLLPILVATTVVNLVVSIVMVNYVGIAGVIIGTLVGNTLSWYPYMRHFLSTLSLSWKSFWSAIVLRTYPQAILCAIVVWAVVEAFPPGNLLQVALLGIGGLSFYWLLFYFTGLESSEREMFGSGIVQRLKAVVS